MTPKRSTRRLCTQGYAEILRSLADEPCCVQDLAIRHNTTQAVMRGITRRLHALRMIRICCWQDPIQGPHIRIFGFGGQPDEPRPLTLAGRVSQHNSASAPPPRPRAELTAFASLIHALSESRSLTEINEVTGIGRHSLSRNLRHMKAIGLVYVADWLRRPDRTGGSPLPLYRIGIDKADKARPKVVSKQESNQKYNAARRDRRQQLTILRALATNSSVFNQAA